MPVFPSVRAPVGGLHETIYTDPKCQQSKAAITDLNGIPIPQSRVMRDPSGLMSQFIYAGTVCYSRGENGNIRALYPDIGSQLPITVTGSKGANAALTSLIAALVSLGIPIVDGTT
jgi:hypothetical protein